MKNFFYFNLYLINLESMISLLTFHFLIFSNQFTTFKYFHFKSKLQCSSFIIYLIIFYVHSEYYLHIFAIARNSHLVFEISH